MEENTDVSQRCSQEPCSCRPANLLTEQLVMAEQLAYYLKKKRKRLTFRKVYNMGTVHKQ